VIGVIGGTGFATLVDGGEPVGVETPYGTPSAPVTVGEVGGARVAFLPRHGADHELPPHRIPYRANLWALREVGVTRIVATNASGALTRELEIGDFVLCDQFVDRTSGSRTPAPGSGSACATAARWSRSRGLASPVAPSRSGSPRWAGTS
jgi:5'-methylthioadenosine phosphorylase